MSQAPLAPRKHSCSLPGCKNQATCIPALVVPASPLSQNKKFEGVRSVLWLPLCTQHFTPQNLSSFINSEGQKMMRDSIEMDFRHNGALAAWHAAKFQAVPTIDPEYVHYEQVWFEVEVEGRDAASESGSVH